MTAGERKQSQKIGGGEMDSGNTERAVCLVFVLTRSISEETERANTHQNSLHPPLRFTQTPLHNLHPSTHLLSTGSESSSTQALTRVPERQRGRWRGVHVCGDSDNVCVCVWRWGGYRASRRCVYVREGGRGGGKVISAAPGNKWREITWSGVVLSFPPCFNMRFAAEPSGYLIFDMD